MKWFEQKRNPTEHVLATRITLYRNFSDCPFPSKCTLAEKLALGRKISSFFENECRRAAIFEENGDPRLISESLFEERCIDEAISDSESIVFSDTEKELFVLFGGSEHIVISCATCELSTEKAYEKAAFASRLLSRAFPIAFNERLGYLTAFPSRVGNAMKSSVLIHLPALTVCGRLPSLLKLCEKLGVTVRELCFDKGERKKFSCLYEISRPPSGEAESESLGALSFAVTKIRSLERELCGELYSNAAEDFADGVCRAYGILRYAEKLSFGEFLRLWSELMTGFECGIAKWECGENLSELLIKSLPSHILADGESADKCTREAARAKLAKRTFLTAEELQKQKEGK